MFSEVKRSAYLRQQKYVSVDSYQNVFCAGSTCVVLVTGIDPLGALWDTFHKQKANIEMLTSDSSEIGVTHPCEEDGYFYYFAGGRAHSSSSDTEYANWVMPKGEYIVCTFEAEDFQALVTDALYKAQGYLFNTWLPNHKLTIHPFSVEYYESHCASTAKMEIWVMPLL